MVTYLVSTVNKQEQYSFNYIRIMDLNNHFYLNQKSHICANVFDLD